MNRFYPVKAAQLLDFDNADFADGEAVRWNATSGKFQRSSIFRDFAPTTRLGLIGPLPSAWPNTQGNPTSDPSEWPEHLIVNSNGGNVVTIMQTNPAGFSCIRTGNDTGTEHSAFGEGNTNCGAPYQDVTYWESYSRSSLAYWPHRIIASVIDTGAGLNARRVVYEHTADGQHDFYASPDPSSAMVRRVRIDYTDGVYITGGLLLNVDPGVSSGGWIRFYDDNWGIYGRENGGTATNYYAYGDTLANSGGHRWFTGGVKASQTLRFQVADDGIDALLPTRLRVSGTTRIETNATGIGFFAATPVAKPASTADIKDALVALGLLTDSGATPLNLDSGALSAGIVNASTGLRANGGAGACTLDVIGSGMVGNLTNTATRALVNNHAFNIIDNSANQLRLTKTGVATISVQINTTSSVNRLDWVDADNSNVVPLSVGFSGSRNVGIAGCTTQYGGGVGVLGIANAGTVPASTPSGGGALFSESGSGKWKGSSGNTVIFAPVAPTSVTGSRGGNAALASLITAIAAFGYITDGTSA